MNRKIWNFVIEITPLKIAIWMGAIWMLLSLILANTNAVEINIYCFGKKGTTVPSGDQGVLVVLTTWMAWILPIFIRGRLDKIFGGVFLFFFGFIVFIGTLVSDPSAATVLGWSIPAFIVSGSGVLLILDGSGIINLNKPRKKRNTTNNSSEFTSKRNDSDYPQPEPRTPSNQTRRSSY